MSGRWPLDITVRQNQGCRDFLVSYFLIREQHSGIHIKRSFVLVGFFVCLLRVLTNQLYVHQSTCTLGSSASHLTTGSFSAGPTAWPLLLSEGPPLQGLQDTSFTFLWMWHPSRRAADPLLGLCHRSARKTSPFARQRLPMQGPDEVWGVLQVFSVYKAHAKAEQDSREQGQSRNDSNLYFWTSKCWLA